jgi:amidophosphoribosyltransferase
MDIAQICQHIGADSLAYLSLEGMDLAVREAISRNTGHCAACFSGQYPISIPQWLFDDTAREKIVFEEMWG